MSTSALQQTKETARKTVMHSKTIEKDIRRIVVQALREGKMDSESIKQTLNQVIEGACAGSTTQLDKNSQALKQVVTGMDAALSQVAEASKLAIEEASANLQMFSDHDLKRALHDLEDLEYLFFDTLREVASKGKDTSHETLHDLLNHLQQSGSAVGQSVTDILTGLQHDLSKNGRLEKIQLADIAKASGAIFARVSSGILAGIADSLEPKNK
ncbi:MAG: hypothetical protein K9L22_11870 [Methylococcaceae bacterium]|nr:hypothetical protein [Methylococcaceae bacterium]